MSAEIYSKTVCPHCDKAKMLLRNRKIAYTEIDAPAHMDAMTERVVAAGGNPPRTVPQIFIDDEYIGGADDLVLYFAQRDLGDFKL